MQVYEGWAMTGFSRLTRQGSLGATCLLLQLFAAGAAWAAQNPPAPTSAYYNDIDHVADEIDLLNPVDEQRFNFYLENIEKETAIDIRMHFLRLTGDANVDAFTTTQAATLRFGGGADARRGVLVVWDAESQRLRVAALGLAEYLPETFIANLIERHTASFFQSGDVTTGLRLMVRMLHERIRDHMLGGEFSPSPIITPRDDEPGGSARRGLRR